MTILDHCGKLLMRSRVVGFGTGISTEIVDYKVSSALLFGDVRFDLEVMRRQMLKHPLLNHANRMGAIQLLA